MVLHDCLCDILFRGCYLYRMSQSDSELLQRYVAERAEPAFAELVRRHIDLVFFAALRLAEGDRSLAEDVTQDVFTDLARKATRLTTHTSLVGWLYTSTRYCARDALRSDRRRHIREQQAFAMNQLLQPEPSLDWEQLRPLLDDAMHSLNESDRQAVLLRFFNRLPLAEVGARLAVSENTARMRVDRALDKLRGHLAKRGFTSTAAVLATMLSNHAVQSAPMGLAATVTTAAVAVGATTAAGGLAVLMGLKGLLAAATVVAILVAAPVVRHFASANRSEPLAAQMALRGNATDSVAAASQAPTGAAPLPAQPAGSVLALHLLTGKNDKPLAGVQIDVSAWAKGVLDHRTVAADAEGTARVFYPADTTNLVLITEKDGFADTKLSWNLNHGEKIPLSYVLRPDAAVPLAGKVVDEQGQPVAGATVTWDILRSYDAPGRLSSESHTLAHVPVTTDANGHWSMKRADEDVIRLLTAMVAHPQHGNSYVRVGSGETLDQRGSETEQQLREGSAVFTLGSTCTVMGTVVDMNGNPVAGAKILVGRLMQQNHRQTTTLADGSFTIDGCVPEQETPVTAEADGFAPAGTHLDFPTNTAPVRLTMQQAQTLRLRVVGPDGAPIAGASVAYDWTSFRTPLRTQDFPNLPGVQKKLRTGRPVQAQDYTDLSVAQVKFREKTGPDGRLSWTNAPSGGVMFMVNAPGFTAIHDAPARADGKENVIALTQGTLVTGAVRDDSTGAAIPRFHVVLGFPEIRPFRHITIYHWIRNRAADFRDGTYSQDLGGPLVIGGDNPGYVMKIEAVDYEPFISRIFQEGEGEVRLDVSLHPSKWTIMTVLKPNGQLAAGADVGLVSFGANLKLVQGHFQHDPLSTSVLKTEGDGRLRLTTDTNVTRIVIACDDGYLSVTPASLQTNSTVSLEPWGSIEGTCVVNGKPVAGAIYKLAFEDEDFNSLECGMEAYQVKSDAQGHFTIQRAPPGNIELLRVDTFNGPNGQGFSYPGGSYSIGPDGKRVKNKDQEGRTPLTVLPGQTTTVTLTPDPNPPKRGRGFWNNN
jgi:RNA polymerase sigma factor (sigma-70 family)